MTIGQKLHAVMDHLTPGHKTVPGSSADGTTNTLTETHKHAQTTSSNSSAGTMEQAAAGEYRADRSAPVHGGTAGYNSNPASAGAVGGGLAAGVTGSHPHDSATVCVPGNQTAPVPVGEKKFVVTEDHAVAKERVERWTEHQPVEREYVTKVEETGHVATGNKFAEGAVGAERVVNEHTCYPTNTTTVTGVAGDTAPVDGNRTR